MVSRYRDIIEANSATSAQSANTSTPAPNKDNQSKRFQNLTDSASINTNGNFLALNSEKEVSLVDLKHSLV
jgi:hypothetical protein